MTEKIPKNSPQPFLPLHKKTTLFTSFPNSSPNVESSSSSCSLSYSEIIISSRPAHNTLSLLKTLTRNIYIFFFFLFFFSFSFSPSTRAFRNISNPLKIFSALCIVVPKNVEINSIFVVNGNMGKWKVDKGILF